MITVSERMKSLNKDTETIKEILGLKSSVTGKKNLLVTEDWRLQKKAVADCIFQEGLHHPHPTWLSFQPNFNTSPINW